MDLLLMLVLSALVTWVVEKTADATLKWVINRLRRDHNSNYLQEPEEQGE